MQNIKKIQKETINWDMEDNERSQRVNVSMVMDMVDEETQRELEKEFNSFFNKVMLLVPDTTPTQGGPPRCYSC